MTLAADISKDNDRVGKEWDQFRTKFPDYAGQLDGGQASAEAAMLVARQASRLNKILASHGVTLSGAQR